MSVAESPVATGCYSQLALANAPLPVEQSRGGAGASGLSKRLVNGAGLGTDAGGRARGERGSVPAVSTTHACSAAGCVRRAATCCIECNATGPCVFCRTMRSFR